MRQSTDMSRVVKGVRMESAGQGMETWSVFGSKNLDQNLECDFQGAVWSDLLEAPGCLSRLILYRPSLLYNPATQAFIQILNSSLKFPITGPLHMLFLLHLKLPALLLVNSFRRFLNCYFIREAFPYSPSSTITFFFRAFTTFIVYILVVVWLMSFLH